MFWASIIGSNIIDSLVIDNSIKLNAENYFKFLHKTFLMSQPRDYIHDSSHSAKLIVAHPN